MSVECSNGWRFKDADLVRDQNTVIYANGSLLVKNVQAQSTGTYSCIALNGRQSIYSRPASLRLASLPSFAIDPASHTARVGASTSLECAVESVPLPVIWWVKDGMLLRSGDVTQTDYRSRLTIPSVTYRDQGYYSCVATNTVLLQSTNSSQALLTVQGRPALVLPPGNVTVPETYTAVFDCVVIGNPRPDVTWLKVDTKGLQSQLMFQGRISKYPNGTLVLRGAVKEDAGSYTCLARNNIGEDSATASLTVEGPARLPVIALTPNTSTLTTELGSAVSVRCAAEGNPTPRVSWRKANGSLPSNVLVTGGLLTLARVERENDGVYVCMAVNGLGQTQKTLRLSVQYGPVMDERPVSQEVETGSAVVMTCGVTANPPPVYTWQTPAGNVSVTSGNVDGMIVTAGGSLQIANAGPSHHGTYTCLAANRINIITASAVLNVKGPPRFTSTPAGQMVSAGETVEFTCQASGYPAPSILWTKDENLLRTNDKYQVTTSGTLIVRRAGKDDAGIYRCFARNTAGQIDAPATLNIIRFPYFKLPSSSPVTVGLGGDVKLDCQAMGDPVPIQKWERNGSAMIIDDNMHLFTNHTLLIDDIRSHQFGEYTCVAVNLGGVNSTTVTIFPGDFPFLITRPRNTTAVLGTNVTLQCRGQSRGPFSIRWVKSSLGGGDGTHIGTSTEQSVGVGVKLNGDLQFISIRKSDEGWYTCSAVNTEGNVTADPVNVHVYTPPSILSTNSPVSVLANTQAQLSCNVSGDPAPTLRWKSPAGIQVTPVTAQYIPTGWQLTITSVDSEADGGWWTCEACNVVACAIGGVQLLIEGEPVIRTDQSLRNATTVALVCRAYGLPEPTLRYSRGSTAIGELTPGHRVEGAWLYISVASLGDTYTCTAENSHGSSTKIFTKPDAGPSVTATNVTSREITVTWEPVKVSGNLFVTATHMKYHTPSATSAIVSEVSRLPPHRVTGLLPYTTYELAVSVTNVLGTGLYGPSLSITTAAEAPTSPVAVAARVLNSTVTVTWSHSLHLYGNIDDVVYRVSLWGRGPSGEYDTPVRQQTRSANSTLEASIDAEYGSYQVEVTAINTAINMSSVPTRVMVNVSKPAPVFVPEITVFPIDDQSVSVTWNTSNTNGQDDIRGYVIFYRKLDRDDREFSSVTVDDAAKHSAVISNLEEQTTYEVKVAAVNLGGQGAMSRAESTKTKLKLFSLAAYSGVDLGTSGWALAVLAGCISLLLLLLVILCICLQHRRLKKMDSVSFLKPSHRLDRFYLENPKGLYRDKPRRRGLRMEGRGLYTFTNNGYLWDFGDGISADSDVELVKTTWLPDAGRYNPTFQVDNSQLLEAYHDDQRAISHVKPPPLGEIEILPDIRINTSASNTDAGAAYDMSTGADNSNVLDNFILQPTQAVFHFEGTSGEAIHGQGSWDRHSANCVALDTNYFEKSDKSSFRTDDPNSAVQQLTTKPTVVTPALQYVMLGEENVPKDLSDLPVETFMGNTNIPLVELEPTASYTSDDVGVTGTQRGHVSPEPSDTVTTTHGDSKTEARNTTPDRVEKPAEHDTGEDNSDDVSPPIRGSPESPAVGKEMTPLFADLVPLQSNVAEDTAVSSLAPTYVSSARLQLQVSGPSDSTSRGHEDTDIDEFIENAPDPESDGASIHSSDLFTDSEDETQAPLFMDDQDRKTAVLY
ncbi:hemicentin-2-like isoform X2 [Haliotis rubra]|uniref:hemicentin-2-like isoform X2 n=1 Tax=Haliotis rubra TaxID=36100 RepID=UPI001EE5D8F6|nr:hemicentin-2-like isoform X2 [Haliotis rubra]